MKVSLNIIRQYIDFELPPLDQLVAAINAQLGQIERVDELAPKYQDVVIVKVVSAQKHPDADRLTVCLVDDGGVVKDVERNAEGLVQVVCGAPNAREGIFAAWLPPRATVPATYGSDDPFVLDARELRGVKSSGMLAAADELALGADHSGIVEIDPGETRPQGAAIAPGAKFAEVFGLDDTILDIENKMFTHRPDLFGQLGVAREIAGIFGHQFKSPEWYLARQEFAPASDLPLMVHNDATVACPRFMAVAIKGVSVKSSPLWLQIELVRLGGKPINTVVDATNYVMLLTGQPTHAYDYDKLRGNQLGVRMAREGETCSLLNGKSYALTPEDIVIVDGEGIVGLGGVMGGGNSEVSETTTNIVLEVATFDMYAIRKTSMRHGIFTDAVTRFNKGQSPLQNDRIIGLLQRSINDIAGGVQASEVYDVRHDSVGGPKEASIDVEQVNRLLGASMSVEEMAQLLGNVECELTARDDKNATVTVPFWRTDIAWGTQDEANGVSVESTADIAEEIGRLYGFEKLPRALPMRTISPVKEHEARTLKQRLREAAQRAGLNEVLTYSFVHERLLQSVGQSADHAYRLSNALSPDLQYYRVSVLPSLLDKVYMDIRAGFDEFALFEIGKGHNKTFGNDVDGLPQEQQYLDLVVVRKQVDGGAAYFRARHLVEFLLDGLHIETHYSTVVQDVHDDAWAPFDPHRSARVIASDGSVLGIVGELRPEVRARLKLPEHTAAASLSVEPLLHATQVVEAPRYKTLARFPAIARDISLRTERDVPYETLYRAVAETTRAYGDGLDVDIEPTSIYQPEVGNSLKTTTFHIEWTSSERTLTDDDISPIVAAIADATHRAVDAELV